MCRRIRVPENVRGGKVPAVKGSHRVTMGPDITPGWREEKQRSDGKPKNIHPDCYNWNHENWGICREIARSWGVRAKKIAGIW